MSNREIIELANIIAERPCDSEDCAPCIRMGRRCNDYLKAERAIEAGYRRRRCWIPVEERLPEDSCECLAVSRDGTMYLLYYSHRYKAFNATDDDDGDRWKLGGFTHWMPLPELPTMKGEGK